MLLLVGAAVGSVYVYYFWNQSDELLGRTVQDKLTEIAPGWNVTFEKARFDYFQGRVHLYDVVLPGDDPNAPVLEMAEVVLVIDRETLSDPNPAIQQIRIVQPRANLVRGADGVWNIQKLPPLNLPKSIIPECHWEQGVVSIHLEGLAGSAAATRRLESVNVHMIPSGRRQFLIKLTGNLSGADPIACEGRWNIEDRSWSAHGELHNVLLDRQLLDLGAEVSSEFHAALERLEAAAARLGADGHDAAEPPAGSAHSAARALQFEASANVTFRISQWQPETMPEYQFALDILRGKLSHPAVPYPLDELRGRVTLDNQQIEIKDLSARSETTHVRIARGRIHEEGELRPAEFDLEISQLPIDRRLYRLLPEENRRFHDSIQPTGAIDAHMHLEFNGRDRWEHDGVVTARDCTASHVKFPFRVEQINGTIKREGETLELSLEGRSGNQPVRLQGKVKSRGTQTVAAIDIETVGLPIDKKLRAACPPKFQTLIDELRVEGEFDGRVRLIRPAGEGATMTPHIKGRLRNGNVNYQKFPYALAEVSGSFQGTLDNWTFSEFKGRQGTAQLNWGGRYGLDDDGTPRLELDFDAKTVPCDQALKNALPAEWQTVWGEINPQGLLNVEKGKLQWTPGAAPRINFEVELVDGELTIKSFPYPLHDVHAFVGLIDGEVFLRSLTGRHDETRVRASGRADFPEPGEWHLHLADIAIDDLEAGPAFRRTLPQGLRRIVDAFNPRGKLSIAGKLDFRGKQGNEFPVTAAWDTVTVYTGTTITAGIDLKDMHGQARFRGTYDGEVVSGEGQIDLNSVKVFMYTLTDVEGPVSIDATQLIVGSQNGADRTDSAAIDPAQRLTAKFIGGLLGLDAVVQLNDPMRYRAHITLADGDLKRYSQAYMQASHRLEGTMNGKVDLKGIGADRKKLNGSGQLRISRAALYDLPLIVAIFNVLSFVPGDKSAFDQADFLFAVKDERVRFRLIDLVGNAIKLVGHGTVGFDGNVNLEFLSQIGRATVPIPLLREAINELTKGLVGVRVRGPIKDPQAEVRPLMQLDEALKKLWGIRDARGPVRR